MSKRNDDNSDPNNSPLLPATVRGKGDAEIDAHIESKLKAFNTALDWSEGGRDPLRRAVALENLRLAIDPRIKDADVRARSGALLNTIKVLGLDRDVQRFDPNKNNVEMALQKLRESSGRGEDATRGLVRKGDGEAPKQMHGRQKVLLREPSERGVRSVEVGTLRGTVSDTSEDTGCN